MRHSVFFSIKLLGSLSRKDWKSKAFPVGHESTGKAHVIFYVECLNGFHINIQVISSFDIKVSNSANIILEGNMSFSKKMWHQGQFNLL